MQAFIHQDNGYSGYVSDHPVRACVVCLGAVCEPWHVLQRSEEELLCVCVPHTVIPFTNLNTSRQE